MKTISDEHPEIYKEIAVFQQLVQRALGGKYYGLYIHGSLALGDFDMSTSDIDFMVVVSEALSENDFVNLDLMHQNFIERSGHWGNRLEGSYVDLDWLCNHYPPQTSRPYYNDGILKQALYGHEWTLELYTLREYGLRVDGEDLKVYIPEISEGILREATHLLLENSWMPLTDGPYVFEPHYRVYAVVTMSRALYMIEFGQVVSKVVAWEWVCSSIDAKYKNLVLNVHGGATMTVCQCNELIKDLIRDVYDRS